MRDHEDDKITITLDNCGDYTIGDGTYSIDSSFTTYTYDTSGSTIDISTISMPDWVFNSERSNGKYIDFDVLDKYPTAKTLYNQFISVYNMCEEEEKLNGD